MELVDVLLDSSMNIGALYSKLVSQAVDVVDARGCSIELVYCWEDVPCVVDGKYICSMELVSGCICLRAAVHG